MSYVSTQAKLYAFAKPPRIKRNLSKKSHLTKEQYEKGMSLVRKMRDMSAW